MAQGGQVSHGEKAALGQRCVQGRGAMAFAEHEAVAGRILGLLGVDTHLTEIQIGQHVCAGQAAARMAAACAVGALNDAHPHTGRSQL